MYCSNCGYDLKEKQIDKAKDNAEGRTFDSKMVYICPRCGKVIKEGLDENEIKSLSRAAHSEIHKARNTINSGFCFLMVSIILICIGFMFYLMSYKANSGGLLVTNCTEFVVFCILLVLSIAGFTYSGTALYLGYKKQKDYTSLLKDIQNNIFVQ